MHHSTGKAMYGRAMQYMEHMEDMEVEIVKPLVCQLEQVLLFDIARGMPSALHAAHLCNNNAVTHMLHHSPMLVLLLHKPEVWG